MQAFSRNLLVIALGAVAPLAFAQTATPLAYDTPPTHAPTPATPPATPPPSGDDSDTNQAKPTDADDWKDAGKAAVAPTGDTAGQGTGSTQAATHSAEASRSTFATLDADSDGRISTSEAAADTGFNATFAAMDSDHDGYVSDAEYRGYAKASMDNSQGAEHAAPNSAVVARDVFGTLDTDHDGRISTTEATTDSGFNGTFATMDSDGDGYVTDAEYRKHAKTTEKPHRP